MQPHPLISEIRINHAQMEKHQRPSEKLSFPKRFRIFITQIFRESQNRLLVVVGGKNRRAGVSVHSFKGAPLEGGGEKNGVQGQNMVGVCRYIEKRQGSSPVEKNRQKFQIPSQCPGNHHGKGDGQPIQQRGPDADQNLMGIMSQKAGDQGDQVGGLRRSENVTVVQQCIGAEKSSDKCHGIVDAHLERLSVFHTDTSLRIHYSTSAGKENTGK